MTGTAIVDTVFDAMNLAYVALGVVVAIGFLRLPWHQSRAQLSGTILVVVLAAIAVVLMSATQAPS